MSVLLDPSSGKVLYDSIEQKVLFQPGCGTPTIDIEGVLINTDCYPNGFCDDCIVALHFFDINYNGCRTVEDPDTATSFCDPNSPPDGAGCIYEFRRIFPRFQSVVPIGTAGSTTWAYRVQARTSGGNFSSYDQKQITTGNAVLDGTNYNKITWSEIFCGGYDSYDIYRSRADGSPSSTGKIGNVASGGLLELDDIGLPGDGTTPPFAGFREVRWEGFHFGSGCGSHDGCDGGVENTDDLLCPMIVVKIGDTWYFQSYISGVSVGFDVVMELFYAETSDISSPVTNFLTAYSTVCADKYSRSNPFMDIWWGDCTPGSGDSQQFLAAGKNGTAFLTP